jgi:hypothetical protein
MSHHAHSHIIPGSYVDGVSSDDEEEYYVYPVKPLIVFDEGTIHNDSGFCYDMTCPCHRDKELIGELDKHIKNGLITPEDANRIYRAQTTG